MARQRGRVVLRRIDDRRRRGICFRKRRAGLVKKAEELAMLCDADVALLVVSPFDGTFHRFAAPATLFLSTRSLSQKSAREGHIEEDERRTPSSASRRR